jgi:hypothetical protein
MEPMTPLQTTLSFAGFALGLAACVLLWTGCSGVHAPTDAGFALVDAELGDAGACADPIAACQLLSTVALSCDHTVECPWAGTVCCDQTTAERCLMAFADSCVDSALASAECRAACR